MDKINTLNEKELEKLNKKYQINIYSLYQQQSELYLAIKSLKRYIENYPLDNIDINISIAFNKIINELEEQLKEVENQIKLSYKKLFMVLDNTNY